MSDAQFSYVKQFTKLIEKNHVGAICVNVLGIDMVKRWLILECIDFSLRQFLAGCAGQVT